MADNYCCITFLSITPKLQKSPHWYLKILAVSPSHQGQGLGARLLRLHAKVADACECLYPTYLECSGANNQSLYSHFGFATATKVSVAPAHLAPMNLNGGVAGMIRRPVGSHERPPM